MNRIFAGLTLAGILGVCAWNAAPVYAQKEGDSAPQSDAKSERKTHPKQATVATKKEFASVEEKDAAVTKALDASKLAELKKSASSLPKASQFSGYFSATDDFAAAQAFVNGYWVAVDFQGPIAEGELAAVVKAAIAAAK